MHAVPIVNTESAAPKSGLASTPPNPSGKREYIVMYRGRRIRNAEADKARSARLRYMFEINSRWTIDGSRRWNVARYVNHSCRPNAEAIERRGPIIVYCARRKIKPDEEITVDYGKDYFAAFIGKSRCRCPKCRERRAEQQTRRRAKTNGPHANASGCGSERRAAAKRKR